MILPVIAFDTEIVIPIDESQLPYSGSEYMDIGLEDNYTIFLNQYLYNDYVSLNFPSNYSYNGTDISDFYINYTVDNMVLSNDTNLIVGINITSNHPSFNESHLYGMTLIVKINESTELVKEKESFHFYMINKGYGINITENLLPQSGKLDFHLAGEKNFTVNVTDCGTWLICPETFTFVTGNETLYINYSIPINASLGVHNRTFTVTSGNVTKVGNVMFNILAIEYEFKEYVWKDGCMASDEAYDVCWAEYEAFQIRRLAEAMRKARNTSKEIIINETEKLVMVGSIDDELKFIYDNLLTSNGKIQSEYAECTNRLSTCLGEKSTFDKTIKEIQDNADKTNTLTLEQAKNIETDFESKRKSRRNWIIFIIIVVGLIVAYLMFLYKANHKMPFLGGRR